jgi:hypothetical protein
VSRAALKHYADPVLEDVGPAQEPDLEPSRYMRLLGAIDGMLGRRDDGWSESRHVWASTYAVVWAALGYTLWVSATPGDSQRSSGALCVGSRLRSRTDYGHRERDHERREGREGWCVCFHTRRDCELVKIPTNRTAQSPTATGDARSSYALRVSALPRVWLMANALANALASLLRAIVRVLYSRLRSILARVLLSAELDRVRPGGAGYREREGNPAALGLPRFARRVTTLRHRTHLGHFEHETG